MRPSIPTLSILVASTIATTAHAGPSDYAPSMPHDIGTTCYAPDVTPAVAAVCNLASSWSQAIGQCEHEKMMMNVDYCVPYDYVQACDAAATTITELTKERDIYHERAWRAEGKIRWHEGRQSVLTRRVASLIRACGTRCRGL